MKPTLISSARVVTLQQQVQTLHDSEHDPFAVMLSDRADALALSTAALVSCDHAPPSRECRAKNRRTLVSAYDASVKQIARLQDDIEKLLGAVLSAFVWNGSGDRHAEFRQQKLKSEKESLRIGPLEIADALFAEVMLQDDESIKATFRSALDETLQGLFGGFRATLERLQERRIVGGIRWFGDDVCAYDFYRVSRGERKTGESTDHRTDRIEHRGSSPLAGSWSEFDVVTHRTHFQTFDALEHHEHQLFNAARFQFPAKQVRKPKFVEELLRTIPPWMQKHIFVVEGDMLRETVDVSEKHVASRDETFELSRTLVRAGLLYSPAVTLGSFVLTGWSKRDMT